MSIHSIIGWLTINPKRLFKLDLVGAALSTMSICIIYWKLYAYFGLSEPLFEFLVIITLFICNCSSYCCSSVNDNEKKNHKPYLLKLIFINTFYCCITVTILIGFYSKLTLLGLTYFIVEIIIIIGLIFIEKRVYDQL